MLNAHIAILSGLSFFAAGYIAPAAFAGCFNRRGGLLFFRFGRFGGSFYVAKRKIG